jgi:hypothetical protein
MKFPANHPDFNATDKNRLKELGVSDAQIKHLRLALPKVRMLANPNSYAPRSDVVDVLSKVRTHADGLIACLVALAKQSSAAHSVAHALIEEGYWQGERLNDDGPTSSHHLIARLQALAKASQNAASGLPKGQTRPRLADPRPIKWIEESLFSGWLEQRGSRVRNTPAKETLADMIAAAKANPPLPPYPKEFKPSKAENGVFREIVGICYRTVDGNNDPLRAIESYLAIERKKRKDLISAIENSVAVPKVKVHERSSARRKSVGRRKQQ